MRLPTPTLALLFFSCGSLVHAQAPFDPFKDPIGKASSFEGRAEEPVIKISTKFTCVSSGTLEGRGLDIRVKSIVSAISEFHATNRRLPEGIKELAAFCEKRQLALYDLLRISSLAYVDGVFTYSASYGEGALHLSHIPGYYLTADMIQQKEAEPDIAPGR